MRHGQNAHTREWGVAGESESAPRKVSKTHSERDSRVLPKKEEFIPKVTTKGIFEIVTKKSHFCETSDILRP